MANQLANFDPVGNFQRARSNALTIQRQEQDISNQPKRNALADLKLEQARVGAQRESTQFDQGQVMRRAKVLNQSAQALLGLNPADRPAAFNLLEPELEKFGIPRGTFVPTDLTDGNLKEAIASTQGFIDSGDPSIFQKGATALVETGEGPAFATSILDPRTGQTRTSITPINAELVSKLGETGQVQTVRKIQEASGRANAKGISERNQDVITKGLAAADSTATIKRGIELLNTIETGGVDRARLRTKQFFGVESGDEGELSNLLGKAVLSQLRETFGAAFTAKESDSLQRIEANIGKSAAANRRLLQNALRIAERSAKRGIDRAVASGDFRTAADIQDALDFSLQSLPDGMIDNNDGTFTLPDGRIVVRDD